MLADTAWRPGENPIIFTCGPTALVETVANYLLELGYDRSASRRSDSDLPEIELYE
jgi:hypothetical protein